MKIEIKKQKLALSKQTVKQLKVKTGVQAGGPLTYSRCWCQ